MTHYKTDLFGNSVEKQWTQTQADNTATSYSYQYWYDAQNREVKHVDTTGLSHETRYNGYGDIEAKGVNGQYQEQYKYDKVGRLFSTNKETGAPQLYLYDQNGNATAEFILVSEDLVDDQGNPLNVDFSAINAPADLKGMSALNSQMKVSIYDERNRLTNVFEAPHDYQQLNADIIESITDTGWVSEIDYDNWSLTTSDVESMTFTNGNGVPVFEGEDNPNPISTSENSPTTSGYTYVSALPSTTSSYEPQDFNSFSLSEVQEALDLAEGLTDVDAFYSDITLTSDNNSYSSAWKREKLVYSGEDENANETLFTKTIVRVWREHDATSGKYYIYRDIEKQAYAFTADNIPSADEIQDVSFETIENDESTGSDDISIVTLTSTKDGVIEVEGGPIVTHEMQRAFVQVKNAQTYAKVGAGESGSGTVSSLGRGSVSVNVAKKNIGVPPRADSDDRWDNTYFHVEMSFKVNIPQELQDLGIPLEVSVYGGHYSSREYMDSEPVSAGTDLTEIKVTNSVHYSRGAYYYQIMIRVPSLGNKLVFDKTHSISHIWSPDSTTTINGTTTSGFVVIEEKSTSPDEKIYATSGGIDLSAATRKGVRYILAVSDGTHKINYKTLNFGGALLNDAKATVKVGLGVSTKASASNYEYKASYSNTHTREVSQGVYSSDPEQGTLDDAWKVENDLQRTVTQAYTASYLLGIHNSRYMIHRSQRYNAFGEVIAEIDGNGNERHLFYDTLGRVTHRVDPKVEVALDYASADGNLKEIEAHPITRYYYNAQGETVATDDANSYLNAQGEDYSSKWDMGAFYRTQTFNGGLLTSESDALGNTTTHKYDALGNRRVMVRADGQYQSYTYDMANRLTESRYFASLSTYATGTREAAYSFDAYSYDELGNRLTHTNVLDNVEKYRYDGEGRVIKHTSFGNRDVSYRYEYDESIGVNLGGFIKETTTGLNTETDGSYKAGYELRDEVDYFGRIRKHRDLGGHWFTYEYNQAGWLTSQSGTTAFSYGESEIPSSIGFREELRDRQSQNIKYEYYANGRIRRISDEGINSYADFRYDANGNVVDETYSDGSFTSSDTSVPYQNVHATYDALGRVKTIKDSDQYELVYSYDAVGNRRRVWTKYDNYVISENQRDQNSQEQDFYYSYDMESRFTVTMGELNDSGVIDEGHTGYSLKYDVMGNRKGSKSAHLGSDGQAKVVDEKYYYDDYGRLESVWLYDSNYENKTGTGIQYNANGDFIGKGFIQVAYRKNDELGRTTEHYIYDYRQESSEQYIRSKKIYSYDADNQVIVEKTYKQEETEEESVLTGTLKYAYLNDGMTLKQTRQYVSGSDVEDINAADVTTDYFYNTADRFDSYKASKVVVTGSLEGQDPGTSYYAYNSNGHNLFVHDYAAKRSLTYINNHRGQIIQRDEVDWTPNDENKPIRRKFYYLDGIVRGDMGNDNVPSRTDYVQYLASEGDQSYVVGSWTYTTRSGNGDNPRYNTRTSDIVEKIGYSRMKRIIPVTSADFDQNFQPINPDYPGKASGYYTTAEGDTLQAIAASQWGDSSLWYMLADANGLSGAETLTAGLNLVIPNVVTNVHNNAGTFRPYDPGLAIGDTTPTLPEPPPPPNGGKCGGAGMIVMVVAIAVTAIVAPYAAGAIANSASATVSLTAGTGIAGTAGLGTLGAGTSIAASAAGYASVAAGGFIGGLVGSTASQLVAKGLGVQDHFSLRSAIRGGLTSAATMAVGAYTNNAVAAAKAVDADAIKNAGKLAELGKWTRTAANAITTATAVGANYLAGGITNTPRSFRWRDVATSFLSTTASTGLGEGFTGNALLDGGLRGALNSSYSSLRNGSLGSETIHGIAAGTLSEGIRVAVYDSEDYRPDYVSMMAGVLGNTIGSLALAGIAGGSGRSNARTVEQEEMGSPVPMVGEDRVIGNGSSFETAGWTLDKVSSEPQVGELYLEAVEYASMNNEEGGHKLLGLYEQYGDQFIEALESGGGGQFGKYYSIPKDRVLILLGSVGAMLDGSPEVLRNLHSELQGLAKLSGDKSYSYMANHATLGIEDMRSVFHYSAPRILELESMIVDGTAGLIGHQSISRIGAIGTNSNVPNSAVSDEIAALHRIKANSESNLTLNQRINLKGAVIDEYASLTEGLSIRQTRKQVGPVLAGVMDSKTGDVFFGLNSGPGGKLPDNLTPLLSDRIPDASKIDYIKTQGAGSHAEIHALNDAFIARPNADISDFLLYTINSGQKGSAAKFGTPVPRCPHCEFITDGVQYFPEPLKYGK
ncbi:YwqJ-related putative deaminase [Hahella ganghwensis]|uniref:YwqJ-related putative deaminase n=1 Tax=Hahella ganghwensis TaxID=286420 RepID=UPI0014616C22|nr:YwqJ-related putative deaminase [Hahella ganghwensis]